MAPFKIQNEKTMFKIGDLCPLFFSARNYEFEKTLGFCQIFDTEDTIVVEVFSDTAPVIRCNDLINNSSRSFSVSSYRINDNVTLYHVSITGLDDSVYSLSISASGKSVESLPFEVCNKAHEKTSLIEYSHSSNRVPFDEIFWKGNDELKHQFRVSAGFLSNGFQPKVSTETFRTQNQECKLIYAVPYKVETLTIGDALGVPAWYAELINKIFCLDSVYLNGEHIVRSESSEVSMAQVIEKSNQYVLTIDVEKVSGEIEGIGGLKQSGKTPALVMNGVAVSLNDTIPDGSILQFSEDKSAFVDTNKFE